MLSLRVTTRGITTSRVTASTSIVRADSVCDGLTVVRHIDHITTTIVASRSRVRVTTAITERRRRRSYHANVSISLA